MLDRRAVAERRVPAQAVVADFDVGKERPPGLFMARQPTYPFESSSVNLTYDQARREAWNVLRLLPARGIEGRRAALLLGGLQACEG